MDVERLMRLKGTVQATQAESGPASGQGLIAAYPRIREEVCEAVGAELTDELARLFPAELATSGRPWKAQAEEVETLLAQIAGWLGGIIEAEAD
ncbi:hypothetical protein LCGC14_2509880, partial [marine sediment metagenome]